MPLQSLQMLWPQQTSISSLGLDFLQQEHFWTFARRSLMQVIIFTSQGAKDAKYATIKYYHVNKKSASLRIFCPKNF